MSCVFDLTDVFELIVYGFNDTAFPQHHFIFQAQEAIFHVVSYRSDESQSFLEEFLHQSF